ncbi:UDP-N-acetylmuramate dehydrogenase [Patescibacteria group bacterium]|nr:UDP-N-acetylmuramate dehydrogenase [Patescibacteria group bacterium]
MRKLITQILPRVQTGVLLAPYTTFRIGGPAAYFFVAETKEDIVNSMRGAKEAGVRVFVLAGGSNVLVSDKGFDGLVVLNRDTSYSIEGMVVRSHSGTSMEELVRGAGEAGLAGLEWAGGLPGSVGGAIRGNAGAFGGEIKDTLVSVEYLNEEGTIASKDAGACAFSYRSSCFKENGWAVLQGEFQLRKEDKKGIAAVVAEHIRYRQEHHPLEYPNAGSVFQNCDLAEIPASVGEEFREKAKNDPFPVLPAAVLIAAAGLQGMRAGDAMVSEKHTNCIVNLGNASSEDVRALISSVQENIREKFGVELKQEIQYVA